jgi:FkbM family methyltransferase
MNYLRMFYERYVRMLYRTLRTFGFRDGGVAFTAKVASDAIPSRRWKLKKLRLRGIAFPVFLRPGTSDWCVLDQVFMCKEYECPSRPHNESVYEFYNALLSRSEIPLIIDCGAHIGLASIWYAQKFPEAKIIAVEPEPENFRILAMNTADYANISAVQAGISDHETHVTLRNMDDNAPWAWQTTETGGDVVTSTIPNLLACVPNAKLLVVKVDVEGSEVALFRSNVDWVTKTPVIVFEAHDWLFNWRGTFHAVASVLTRDSRDYILHGENIFSFLHSVLPHDGSHAAGRSPDFSVAADC